MFLILRRELIYLWYYFSLQLSQIFRYWVLGMVLGSAISVFAKEHIHSLFRSLHGKRLGVLGIFLSSALGIASPLCMYGTIPLAASFSESGMEDDWLAAFMMSSMAGFGGAIKNISIGIASSKGKSHIHSGGVGGSMWSADQDAFLEAMGEAGKSVVDALDGQIVYINVMNRLSVDCDCDGHPAEPDMHDIGILASYDPVALDQACVDLVYAAQGSASLIRRIESRNGIHTIEHAEEIGLGNREYTVVNRPLAKIKT